MNLKTNPLLSTPLCIHMYRYRRFATGTGQAILVIRGHRNLESSVFQHLRQWSKMGLCNDYLVSPIPRQESSSSTCH